jgi:N-formylglutamate deformylase
MKPVKIIRGQSPIVLAMPHTGTYVPDNIVDKLNANGRKLTDTDWHVDRLYRGLLPSATTIKANFHRYVIDANRDPSGKSLYPGQNTTGLCPKTDFDGRSIYKENCAPGAEEAELRRLKFHALYHKAIVKEITRLQTRHKNVVLYDCHSIRSHAPFLFEGALPDFNIGTNTGTTCDPRLESLAADICARADGFTSVVNGRFKGGWTTRHYGHPKAGVHAIQMELAQSTYMSETPPWTYQPVAAKETRRILRQVLQAIEERVLS